MALLALGNTWEAHRQQGVLAVAHDSLVVALKDADRQKSLVDFLTDRGAAAEARADSEAARADSLAKTARKSEIRYVAAKAVAPDTCAPVILAADSAISDAQAEAEQARAALRSAQDAANDYKAGKDTALAALTRLRAAAVVVDKAARPSWRERLLPRLGFGLTAGVNPAGRPDAVLGLTVGWSF